MTVPRYGFVSEGIKGGGSRYVLHAAGVRCHNRYSHHLRDGSASIDSSRMRMARSS